MGDLNDILYLAGVSTVKTPKQAIDESVSEPETELVEKVNSDNMQGPFTTNRGRRLFIDCVNGNKLYDKTAGHYVELEDGEDDPRQENKKTSQVTDESLFSAADVLLMIKETVDKKITNAYRDSEAMANRKFIVPTKIKSEAKKRISELEAAIELDDEKGFNQESVKTLAIEAIEKILDNLSQNNELGYKNAIIYLDTLMSPIIDLLPTSLLKYLRTGQ